MRFFYGITVLHAVGVALSASMYKNMLMPEKEIFPEDVPDNSQKGEIKRRINFELDVLNTKINPEEVYYEPSIAEAVRTLIDLETMYVNYKERLSNRADGEVVYLFQSKAEETRTLAKLDGVIAVTNKADAHELRQLFVRESS